MKKQNVRTISLIVCTFTYLLVGAAVFDALESETEKRRWEALNAIETMVMRKYNITLEDFKVMETVVLKSEPHKAGQQWKFTGAFYYATTVLTTIGYGHSTPSTVGGKLFTMCYAIVGIPLGLVMFQSIGERVNRLSSFVIRTVKQSLHCRQTTASELDLICVVTTLSSLTIAGGAAAFSRFEGWSYFDSVYYCFITLTTIGFGDMVALQKDNALNKKPEYVMFALIFILFGLAIVAASLNLLVLRFVTMNTEDERRDEAQAMQALQVAVRLEGDVITANGSILSGHIGHDSASLGGPGDDGDNTSICSCHCACFRASRHKTFKVRRSPSHIRHLLPHQTHPAPTRPPGLCMPLKDLAGSGGNISGGGGGARYRYQNGNVVRPTTTTTTADGGGCTTTSYHRDGESAAEAAAQQLQPFLAQTTHYSNASNNNHPYHHHHHQSHHLQHGAGGDESRTETTLLQHNLGPPDLPPLYQPQHRASM